MTQKTALFAAVAFALGWFIVTRRATAVTTAGAGSENSMAQPGEWWSYAGAWA